jgi:hypothetical protein
VKSSEDKITRLNLELKDLKAGALASEVADPGAQTIYDNIANDAYNALGEISNTTAAAFNACCDVNSKKAVPKPGTGGASCSMLYQETKDAEKRSTEKAKNRSNN